MKFYQLKEELATHALKKRAFDLLVSLNMRNVEKISIDQVLEYFSKNGLEITREELSKMLDQVEFIYDYNKDQIIFQEPEDDISGDVEVDTDQVEKTAIKVANQGIKK